MKSARGFWLDNLISFLRRTLGRFSTFLLLQEYQTFPMAQLCSVRGELRPFAQEMGHFESCVLQVLLALLPTRSSALHEALTIRIGSCSVDTASQQLPAVFCDSVRSQQLAGLA